MYRQADDPIGQASDQFFALDLSHRKFQIHQVIVWDQPVPESRPQRSRYHHPHIGLGRIIGALGKAVAARWGLKLGDEASDNFFAHLEWGPN
jgi:hypothetical protein